MASKRAQAPIDLKITSKVRRRQMSARVLIVLSVLLCLALIAMDRAQVAWVQKARVGTLEILSPVFEMVAAPVHYARQLINNVHNLAELNSENERLRALVETYEEKEKILAQLRSENNELRELLNFVPKDSFGFISAPVIVDGSGLFARSVLVKAGREQGVRKGQAVVTGDGLIGRIEEVGESVSRVILLNDLNSRIPVMFQENRQRALLAGKNTAFPELEYLTKETEVKEGDVIITSGDGGAFPQGLPVGIVSRIIEDQGQREVRVKLFSDLQNLDFVRIVDYGLTGILDDFYQNSAVQ